MLIGSDTAAGQEASSCVSVQGTSVLTQKLSIHARCTLALDPASQTLGPQGLQACCRLCEVAGDAWHAFRLDCNGLSRLWLWLRLRDWLALLLCIPQLSLSC